jgi:hypothetical protein
MPFYHQCKWRIINVSNVTFSCFIIDNGKVKKKEWSFKKNLSCPLYEVDTWGHLNYRFSLKFSKEGWNCEEMKDLTFYIEANTLTILDNDLNLFAKKIK